MGLRGNLVRADQRLCARSTARSTPAYQVGAPTRRAHRTHAGASIPMVRMGKRRGSGSPRDDPAGLREGLRSSLRGAAGCARTSGDHPAGAVRRPTRRDSARANGAHDRAIEETNPLELGSIPPTSGLETPQPVDIPLRPESRNLPGGPETPAPVNSQALVRRSMVGRSLEGWK